MTKKRDLPKAQMLQFELRKTPEQELWCAVLDRAVLDYSFFFDWFITLQKFAATQHHDYVALMNRELRSLEWFFFSKGSLTHNLNWIMDYCFDSNQGLAQAIRKRVSERYKENLAHNKDHELLKPYLEMLTKGAPLPDVAGKAPSKRPRRHEKDYYH